MSNFLAAGIPFLVLPILTIYLKPEDYAVISLFSALEKFLMSFVGFGLVETIGVQYFRRKKKDLAGYIYTGLLMSMIAAAAISILFYYAPNKWLELLSIPKVWIFLAPLVCLLFLAFNILLVIIRSQEKPKQFLIASVTIATIEVALTLVLVVGLLKGWEGRLLSHLYTGLLISAGSLLYLGMRGYLFPSYQRNDLKLIGISGLALLPDGLSVFALELSDRFFISNMVGMKETGIYSVGSMIAMITLLVVRAFINSFYPDVYSSIQSGLVERKRSIVKKTYIMLGLILLVSVFVSAIFAPIVFHFILEESYVGGLEFVFLISLGYFFLGVYAFFKVYCLQSGKTYFVTMTSVAMIILNLVLNYILIDRVGTIGAAYATCASYFVAAFCMLCFGAYSVKMPWLDRA